MQYNVLNLYKGLLLLGGGFFFVMNFVWNCVKSFFWCQCNNKRLLCLKYGDVVFIIQGLVDNLFIRL